MFRTASYSIVLVVLLVSTSILLSPLTAEGVSITASGSWPMYQGGASHTGYVPLSLNPADFSLYWQRDLGERRLNPVTAAAGKVFVSEHGRRMTKWSAQYNFVRVSRAIGLRPPGRTDRFGRGPRLHDLRHRFAVSTLIQWYRSGVDVDREMPKLATYLGHAHPNNVYWYLEAVPELLQLAMEHSRRSFPGGAP